MNELEKLGVEYEDLGNHSNNSKRDKNSKSVKYFSIISEAEAKERQLAIGLDDDELGLVARQRDISLNLEDYRREAQKEITLRANQANCESMLLKLEEATEQNKTDPDGVTEYQASLLKTFNKKKLEALLVKFTNDRLSCSKAKLAYRKLVDEDRKEVSKQRDTSSGAIWKNKEGLWVETQTMAPNDINQPTRRNEQEVAREYVTHMVKPEKLRSLDFEKIITLVREYGECFTTGAMFRLLGNTIKRLEKDKYGMTRSLLAEAIKPTLTRENQLLYEQAKSAVFSSKEGTYEMNLPALATPRAKKVNEDGKSPKTLEMKNNLKRIRLEKEYDTVKRVNYNQMGYKKNSLSYTKGPNKPYGGNNKAQSRFTKPSRGHFNGNNRDSSRNNNYSRNNYLNNNDNPNGNNRYNNNRGGGNQPNGNRSNFKPRSAPYPNGKPEFQKNPNQQIKN
jgi:hypothetical protein